MTYIINISAGSFHCTLNSELEFKENQDAMEFETEEAAIEELKRQHELSKPEDYGYDTKVDMYISSND